MQNFIVLSIDYDLHHDLHHDYAICAKITPEIIFF